MIPPFSLIQVAIAAAQKLSLDPALVCSMCDLESSWNPEATRYESGFYFRYISSMKGLSNDEMRLRATSIGLMQVMGQTAREQGYTEPLESLMQPADAVAQGCIKLKKCLDLTGGDVRMALLKYNGGANIQYPSLVMSRYPKYEQYRTAPNTEAIA